MNWNWVYNISCIGYITGDVQTFNEKCPKQGKEKGWCVNKRNDCEYFMGCKTSETDDITDMKGCCAWIKDNTK